MAKKQEPANSTSRSSIIARLSGEDALAVLRRLAEDEELAARIEQVAQQYLSARGPHNTDEVEELAEEVRWALEELEIEDAWAAAGRTRHGYVEPGEVAYEMVARVIAPYLEQLKHQQQLGMGRQAKYMCMAVMQGLYLYEHETNSSFKEWASDAFMGQAEFAFETWLAGKPAAAQRRQMEEFIAERLTPWHFSLPQHS